MKPSALDRMARAAHFYDLRGFKPIDVPWTIGEDADNATKPKEARPIFAEFSDVTPFIRDRTRLPGSGEQGFIQMLLDEELAPGMYQTVTPCWRDEKVIDDLHRPYFWKLELIVVGSHVAPLVAQCALEFFKAYVPGCEIVPGMAGTNDVCDIVGYDMEKKRTVELGSYGHRAAGGFQYTYGTGCAEPRLGVVVENNAEWF